MFYFLNDPMVGAHGFIVAPVYKMHVAHRSSAEFVSNHQHGQAFVQKLGLRVPCPRNRCEIVRPHAAVVMRSRQLFNHAELKVDRALHKITHGQFGGEVDARFREGEFAGGVGFAGTKAAFHKATTSSNRKDS